MYKLIISLLLICFAFGLKAQQKMSLEECRQLAYIHSEQLKIADLQIEKAKAEKAAIKTQYLPSLSGSVMGVYLNKTIQQELYLPTVTPNLTTGELTPNIMTNPITGEPIIGADGNPVFNLYAWLPLEISMKGAYMAGVSLEQAIYTGGKINTGNKMAAIGLDMADENKVLQQTQTLYEADQAYWLYVSVKEKVKLAATYKKLLEKLVETVTNAYQTGMLTKNEVLKAQVKLNEVKLQLQKAQSGLELTRMALCRVTGLDYTTPIEASDSIIIISDEVIISEINDVTLRPEYTLMKKQVEMAEQNTKIVRADYLPMAGLSVGYNYIGGIKFNQKEYTSGNLSAMASIKIPIFHWGEGVKKTQSAKLNQAVKELELEKNSKLLQLEAEQARLNLLDAKIRVELSAEALIQAKENLKISNDNYELGLEILPNLLDAQAQWQNAYSETIDAKTDFKLKETAYLKASGKLN